MRELYFDTAATTPVYVDVVRAMQEVMIVNYGNPSSPHSKGTNAKKLLHAARTTLARTIGAQASEVYFTSGATESNNLMLFGLMRAHPKKKKIIISSIEHSSVREPALALRKQGYAVVEVPVDSAGIINMQFLERVIDSSTLIVSVIHGNNVIGTMQDVRRIGQMCRKKGVLFHTDATQSFGKQKIFVHDWSIDLLTASAHKIGGPRGIGLLYFRKGVRLSPIIYGGGQEKGLRSGTENVVAAVGFAQAVKISQLANWRDLAELRKHLSEEFVRLGGIVRGAHDEESLPHILYVTFPHTSAMRLVYRLSQKEIFISMGSACESRADETSSVGRAIGLTQKNIDSSVRISLPATVQKKDIAYFVKTLEQLL
jgi:cysteine desulfurase